MGGDLSVTSLRTYPFPHPHTPYVLDQGSQDSLGPGCRARPRSWTVDTRSVTVHTRPSYPVVPVPSYPTSVPGPPLLVTPSLTPGPVWRRRLVFSTLLFSSGPVGKRGGVLGPHRSSWFSVPGRPTRLRSTPVATILSSLSTLGGRHSSTEGGRWGPPEGPGP